MTRTKRAPMLAAVSALLLLASRADAQPAVKPAAKPAATGAAAGGAAPQVQPANAPPAPPPRLEGSPPLVVPAGTASRITVRVPTMPPTRTHCVFEETVGRGAITVHWDPADPGALSRSFTLAPGSYTVACFAEPARHALSPNVDFSWRFTSFDDKANQISFATEGATVIAKVEVAQLAAAAKAPVEELTVDERVVPTAVVDRAFGPMPEAAVAELFSVIAEVVVERAKAKGMKLLENKLTSSICAEDAALKLPRTCKVLRAATLDTLAGSGEAILDALVGDFVEQGVQKIDAALEVKGLEKPLRIAVDGSLAIATNRREGLQRAGQRMVVELGRVKWDAVEVANKKLPDEVQQLFGLLFDVLRECQRGDTCELSRVEELVQHGEQYFGAKEDAVKLAQAWGRAPSWILRARGVLSPAANATESQQLRDAIDLFTETFEIAALCRDSAACLTNLQQLDRSRSLDTLVDRVRSARRLLLAASERDLVGVVTAFRDFVELDADKSEKQIRLQKTVTALVAFMATPPSDRKPTEAELAERRAARKSALNAVIDAQTARGQRLGSWIVSLGSSVGPSLSWAYLPAAEGGGQAAFQLQPVTVTLGFAVDHHASNGFGFHAELAPFNIGNYVTYRTSNVDAEGKDTNAGITPVSWADAVSPNATLGITYVVKEADIVLLLGATGGYAARPAEVEAEKNRAFYAGALIGAYIPILDFN